MAGTARAFRNIWGKVKELREQGLYANYTQRERKKIAVLHLRMETLRGRDYTNSNPHNELWDRAELAALEWALETIKNLEAENEVLREQNFSMNKTIVDGVPMGPVGATYGLPGTDDMCPNCVTLWKCNGPHTS